MVVSPSWFGYPLRNTRKVKEPPLYFPRRSTDVGTFPPIVLILASVPEEELRDLVPSEVQGFPVVIQGIRPYEPVQPE